MPHCIEIVALDTENQVSVLKAFQKSAESLFPGLTFEYLEGNAGGHDSLVMHTGSDEMKKKMREFVASSMEVTEPRVQPPQRWKPLKNIRSPD